MTLFRDGLFSSRFRISSCVRILGSDGRYGVETASAVAGMSSGSFGLFFRLAM